MGCSPCVVIFLQEDMEKYCGEHPEFRPRVIKTFLSKAEQKLKDRIDGKPEKPPRFVATVLYCSWHNAVNSTGMSYWPIIKRLTSYHHL